MQAIVDSINGVIWSKAIIYFLLGSGLYFTYRTRFVQVRHFGEMVRLLIGGKASEKGVSSFQAFALAISARVGTGNIAGVAAAIAIGGPGAVFWMWMLGFIGSATSFIECTLAQIYKSEIDGEYRGGPAYYIEKTLGMKWYSATFAIACAVSTTMLLPGVQSNSISASLNTSFGIAPAISGGIVVAMLAAIIFGGAKRIGKVAEMIVPFMAGFYILVALIVMVLNITALPGVFALIIKSAFGIEPAFAGIVGTAIMTGVKRGIYSNESGMGTCPQAAAAAEVSHPVKQGLVQAFSVYVDTLMVCTATAMMILLTGTYHVVDPAGGFIVNNVGDAVMGPAFTIKAVETLSPTLGGSFVSISLFFFAFTTLIASYYFGETNFAYLMGDHNKNKKLIINCVRVAFLAATFYGSLRTAGLAWSLADVGTGIMAWLNVVALLLVGKNAIIALKDYEEQKANGKDPVFDPVKLGIKNADLWTKIKNDRESETQSAANE